MEGLLKGWVKWLGLLVGLPTVAIALFYLWGSASSHDKQTYAAIVNYATSSTENDAAENDTAENDAAVKPLSNDDPATHTIVSYNLGYLSGLANNTTAKTNSAFFAANQQKVIAALKTIQPDIVAFQEIDFDSNRSYNIDQSEAMAQALGLTHGAIAISWDKNYVPFPYWPPTAQFGKILSGQSIISRSPIQQNNRIVLEKVASQPFYYKAFYLDRLAQVSQINLQGKPLTVINVHLEAFDEPTRMNQTKFVRSLAEDYAKTQPVILLGDFNSSLNRREESAFSINIMGQSELFASAVPQADWGVATATFPSNQPEYKLDYIWYTPATIEILNTEVVTAAGEASDHLPLMARFQLK